MLALVRIKSRILAESRIILIEVENRRAVTIELVFTQQTWFAGCPWSLSCKYRVLTHQFLTLASVSIAWGYLIDDVKILIFGADPLNLLWLGTIGQSSLTLNSEPCRTHGRKYTFAGG